MVHVDKAAAAGVVGVLHGLSKRVNTARGSEEGHAYPTVDGRSCSGDPQREEAQLDACGCRSSSRGDMGAASFGTAENGRCVFQGEALYV